MSKEKHSQSIMLDHALFQDYERSITKMFILQVQFSKLDHFLSTPLNMLTV